ncbi:hypothetical protein [Streptomyces sp. NPDC048349]|uniref:hypothetical protein n=1 Tax=Streptomyces sp. NPDC048349 TaxID=3155486 RepID=UPI00341EE9CF
MFAAEQPFAVGRHLLLDGDGLVDPPSLPVRCREVALGDEDVEVFGAWAGGRSADLIGCSTMGFLVAPPRGR